MECLCTAVGSKQVTNAEPPSGECFFNYSFPVNAIAISVRMCTILKELHPGTLHVRLEKCCMRSVKLNYVMTDRDHSYTTISVPWNVRL